MLCCSVGIYLCSRMFDGIRYKTIVPYHTLADCLKEYIEALHTLYK